MKSKLSLPLLLVLSACSVAGSTWSSDICACTPAWFNVASALQLDDIDDADDLTLERVQAGASRLVGTQASAEMLPKAGNPQACQPTPKGADCRWAVWANGGQRKGYVAAFSIAPTGTVTAVAVSLATWNAGNDS